MKKQLRATYEDVDIAQDKIRKYVDKCINNNIPLGKEEREDFINLISPATLGLGTEYSCFIEGKQQIYDLDHVEHFAYWLAYQEQNPVVMRSGEEIEMQKLWKKLRDLLFIVFPYAIEMSIKISKEREQRDFGSRGGFTFGQKARDEHNR